MRGNLIASGVLAALAAVTLTACSSSGGGSHSMSPTSGGTGNNAVPANQTASATHRWWSNAAAKVGSVIDPDDPTSAAGSLHPSRDQYCGMIKQTIAAKQSILPGAGADDPRLKTAATAFIAEIEAVAPSQVSQQWQTVGKLALRLVDAQGKPDAKAIAKSVDVKKVHASVAAIAVDAKTRCGVSLAHTTH